MGDQDAQASGIDECFHDGCAQLSLKQAVE